VWLASDDPAVVDHVLHTTIRELIEATLLSLSSQSATSLSALAPAQRAGAQRLCAMARVYGPAGRSDDVIGVDRKCLGWGMDGDHAWCLLDGASLAYNANAKPGQRFC